MFANRIFKDITCVIVAVVIFNPLQQTACYGKTLLIPGHEMIFFSHCLASVAKYN